LKATFDEDDNLAVSGRRKNDVALINVDDV
jgi:hypothetical protein